MTARPTGPARPIPDYLRDPAYRAAAREVEEGLRRALDAACARLGIDPDAPDPQEGGPK